MTATDRFEQSKQENLDNIEFTRIIAAVRAVGFGWGQFNSDKPDDWFLQRCIELATDVMDSAYNHALECDDEAFCECGGFRATARPDGAVMLQFVLASWWPDSWDDETASPPQPQITRANCPIIVGPRRIQKLHKET